MSNEVQEWEEQARAKINRRKNVQAALSTGAAGTAMLGTAAVLGAKGVRRLKPNTLKRIAPKSADNPDRLAGRIKDAGTQTAVVGTGVGGVSSLNFADVQRREANLDKVRAERAKLAKASSKSVPGDDPAWKPARSHSARKEGSQSNLRWRSEVSEGALRAYDNNLVPQRKRADSERRIGWALQGAGVGGSAGVGAAAKGKFRALAAVPLAAGTGGNIGMRRKAEGTEIESARIRARGFKRYADKQEQVGKSMFGGAGSYVKSAVVKPTGNKMAYTRNAVPQRPKKAPQIVARRTS